MTTNKKTVIDFVPALSILGAIVLIIIAIWILYMSYSFELIFIYPILLSIFFFVYVTIILNLIIKRITKTDELFLEKVFNSIAVSKISFIKINQFKGFGFIKMIMNMMN
jgi:hypothetical protein